MRRQSSTGTTSAAGYNTCTSTTQRGSYAWLAAPCEDKLRGNVTRRIPVQVPGLSFWGHRRVVGLISAILLLRGGTRRRISHSWWTDAKITLGLRHQRSVSCGSTLWRALLLECLRPDLTTTHLRLAFPASRSLIVSHQPQQWLLRAFLVTA